MTPRPAQAETRRCVRSVQGRQGVTLTPLACNPHDRRSISWRVMFARHGGSRQTLNCTAGKDTVWKLGHLGHPPGSQGCRQQRAVCLRACSRRSVLQGSTSRAFPNHRSVHPAPDPGAVREQRRPTAMHPPPVHQWRASGTAPGHRVSRPIPIQF